MIIYECILYMKSVYFPVLVSDFMCILHIYATYTQMIIVFILAYVGVVYLPRGSSSIEVKEAGIARSNYLALRDRHGGYHLNGNWKLDPEGVYSIAGTKFIYRRPYNLPESLVAEGPILEDLVLEVRQLLQTNTVKFRC